MTITEATDMMVAAQFTAPKEGALVNVPRPEPQAGEVLIEVKRAGICGTDIHIWHGDYALARYPLIPGHEFAGDIVAVGDGVKRFAVGDRVTADPNVPCMICPECQRNQFNQCHNLAAVGVTRSGAFANYIVVPERSVFPIGDMTYAAGALIEPLACVVWGLKRVEVSPGDKALLFGAGPMGCLVMQSLLKVGVTDITVVDMSPARLELAASLGASTTITADKFNHDRAKQHALYGFELVVDATGVPKVIEQAITYARPAGTLWVFGVAPESAMVKINPYNVFRHDLRIVGSFAVNKTFQEATALIESGAVKVEPLISHVVPLSEFAEGLRLAEHDPNRMKVQFDLT